MKEIGFPQLIQEARKVLKWRELTEDANAGGVAAAVLSEGGNVYVGVCIDMSCGIGFCAEHAAISAMITAGEQHIRKIVSVWANGVLPPCGRCREFISQVDDRNMDTQVMVAENKVVTLRELIPYDWRAPLPPIAESGAKKKGNAPAKKPQAKASGKTPSEADAFDSDGFDEDVMAQSAMDGDEYDDESEDSDVFEKDPDAMPIEKMDTFFTARVEDYDRHMLDDVPGCAEGYKRMAKLLPAGIDTLLDLGCGTGLELDEIFQLHPGVRVTGIDLTQAMLDKLQEKHGDKDLELITSNYFEHAFGKTRFDAAVSFQSLHHFAPEAKAELYQKLFAALKAHGCYIECDYMVADQREADRLAARNRELRERQGIHADENYHFDTPCTVATQIRLLREAGFQSVEMAWRQENTTLLIAKKMEF